MKQNAKKIIIVLLILFIISGIIILCTIGFKKSIEYQAGTRIEVYLPNGYQKQEIETIAKDSFVDKNFSIAQAEKLNQVVSIKIKDYTSEELDNFKKKISEKYAITEENLQVYEIPVPSTRISTTIKPYVLPASLITILISIYILIRNLRSEEKWKKLLKTLCIVIAALGVYFSAILIFRIPYGSYTMPIASFIYIATFIILVR